MNRHNLGTVIAFEVRRTLSKPGIWLATLVVPLIAGIVMGLSFLGNEAVDQQGRDAQSASFSFTWTDGSGLIDQRVAASFGGTRSTDADADRAAVREGRADAHVDYPQDLTQPVVVLARDKGLMGSGGYEAVARAVLSASLDQKVGNPTLVEALRATPAVELTTYADGKATPGWAGAIAPGIFIVLLYLMVIMLGNQMLNITVEEKENRVTEMILTTIKPTARIVGKLIAVVIVGIVQGVVFSVLIGLAMAAFNPLADLPRPPGPALTIFSIPVTDPGAVVVGALLFLGGFLMFAGLLVMIGSIMPTAKDAGSWFGGIVLMLFLPFYAVMLIVADPRGMTSQILTFFPLTAPVTSMMRNAMGSLSPVEAVVVLAVEYGFAALFIAAGVRLFRTGSLSYDAKLNVRKALGHAVRSQGAA